jgi:hypothetical protein
LELNWFNFLCDFGNMFLLVVPHKCAYGQQGHNKFKLSLVEELVLVELNAI